MGESATSDAETAAADETARPLALVEAMGRILFERRPGDPQQGLDLAFEHLGRSASVMAIATVRFESDGALTITGTWVEGGGTVDTVGVVVAPSELPEHSLLRTRRQPMVFSSDEFGPTYGALLANLAADTTLLGVPVLAAGEVVGAMVMVDGRGRDWDEELLVALSVVAELVLGFLDRCQTENDLRERAEGAELLARLGGHLSAVGAAVEGALEKMTAELGRSTGAASITHFDLADGRATPFVHWDATQKAGSAKVGPMPFDLSPDQRRILVEQRVVRFGPDEMPILAELVPEDSVGILATELAGADLVGVVVVAHDPPANPSAAHLDLVGGIVDLVGQFRARVGTEQDLERRRRVEAVRAEVAATLVEATGADIDHAVLEALARIGRLFETENVNWLDIDQARSTGHLAVSWIGDCDLGAPADARHFALDPASRESLEPYVMTVGEVAARADSTARRPMLVVPTAIGEQIVGALTLELDDEGSAPPVEEVDLLVDIGRLVHQVRRRAVAHAATRRREALDDLQLALASRFLDPEAGDPERTLEWAMAELGLELGAEVVSLVEIGRDGTTSTTSWAATPGAREVVDVLDDGSGAFADFWQGFILAGEPIVVRRSDLVTDVVDPVAAAIDDGFTMIAAPRRGSEADLALSVTVFDEREWTADEIGALHHMAGQFRLFLDAQASRHKVDRRLALDGLVASAAARLVESAAPEQEVVSTVELVGEFFEARSVAWVEVDERSTRLSASHVWQSAAVVEPFEPFAPIELSADAFADVLLSLTDPFVVHGGDLGHELQDASPESVDLVHVVVPVVVRGRPEALFVIQTDDDLEWTDTELTAIKSLATVLHEVLDRDRADRLFSTTFQSAPTGQLLVAADGRILAANESFAALVGIDPIGQGIGRFFEHASTPADLVEGEVQIDGEGRRPWTRVRTAAVRLTTEAETVTVVHVEDATTDRRNRERLRWEATHDDLTGLANRRVLIEALQASLEDERGAAILMIDVDRFKVVNDSLGHNAGDAVLVRIAERLRLSLRTVDLVCRFGGDEFAVLLRDEVSPMELAATAQRVIELLRSPVDIDGTAIVPTCSVGIAVARPGDDVEALMRHADAALYEAKTRGRDRYEIFDDARRDLIQDRLRLETDLRQALLAEQFVPWFQPEYDLATGEIVGTEALVRWDHPEQGVIPAFEFIDVAEEMGLAPQLSRLVLEQSLRAVRGWLDAGHMMRVRVNVAAAQLLSTELHDEIRDGLERYDLSPQHLCVEITERSLMLDPESAATTLQLVGEMGVEVAIDDFGTGFSSLARLKHLPVDTLKIDRSFVGGIVESGTDREIVRTIIGLGRGLGLDIVAEGVETEAQAALLRQLGCRRAQGWLWSRAVAADEVPALLEGHSRIS